MFYYVFIITHVQRFNKSSRSRCGRSWAPPGASFWLDPWPFRPTPPKVYIRCKRPKKNIIWTELSGGFPFVVDSACGPAGATSLESPNLTTKLMMEWPEIPLIKTSWVGARTIENWRNAHNRRVCVIYPIRLNSSNLSNRILVYFTRFSFITHCTINQAHCVW